MRVGCAVAAAMAALAVFYAGFALGQHAGPSGDSGVEQTLLATIDLAQAIDGFPDRQMRLSRVTIAPGGHIGLHGHADDPTVVPTSSIRPMISENSCATTPKKSY